MNLTHTIVAGAFMLASSAATAATIWVPTNPDTNFIQLDFPGNPGIGPGISTNGGTLALFDDSDFGGTALVIGSDGGKVTFTDNMNGSWNAAVFDVTGTPGGSITLSNNTRFALGMDWGLGYFGDTNSAPISSPETYLIVFDGRDGGGDPISGNTLAVDLAPIPVPAAIWLFGSGLIGLAAVARRRDSFVRTGLFTLLAFFLIPNAIADTEPNNSWQTALVLPQDRTIAGIQSDDDWYVINAVVGNRLLIDLTFSHGDGNIDMIFFGDDFVISGPAGIVPGLFRDISAGITSDHEFIEHDISIIGPGAYYIMVSGENLGNGYTLTWTELNNADDGFEQNDSNAAARAITEGVIAFGAQADEDWYSIDVDSVNRRVLASLRFHNTELTTTIDKDLELRDPGGTLIASSSSASGINESIDQVVAAAGTYHLRVMGDNGGDGYALNWAGVSPASSAVFPVPALNEVPLAIANTVTTTENIPYNFMASDFTFSDSEGDSLVSATLTNLSLGGGSLTHSVGTPVNNGDTLTAAQLDTLVYTPPANTSASPLATFDFTVNDIGAGTVAAQMDINVTAVSTATPSTPSTPATSSSSGALNPAWLVVLLLVGVLRRKRSWHS